MTIYEDIMKHLYISRKKWDTQSLLILSTLLGEMSLKAVLLDDGSKFVSDNDAITVLKKNLKSVDENLSLVKNEETISKLNEEKIIINKYLPRQLTEADLRKEISQFIIANENKVVMGDIMKHLKEHYNGLYDGKLASQITKDILNV